MGRSDEIECLLVSEICSWNPGLSSTLCGQVAFRLASTMRVTCGLPALVVDYATSRDRRPFRSSGEGAHRQADRRSQSTPPGIVALHTPGDARSGRARSASLRPLWMRGRGGGRRGGARSGRRGTPRSIWRSLPGEPPADRCAGSRGVWRQRKGVKSFGIDYSDNATLGRWTSTSARSTSPLKVRQP
jgi:hypothetical protein